MHHFGTTNTGEERGVVRVPAHVYTMTVKVTVLTLSVQQLAYPVVGPELCYGGVCSMQLTACRVMFVTL
jgi:hypothetical protein